ncbi:MAG: hypothetical protein DRH93_08365 [Deltaproteobacteria bacterium]|nr:MAG: hypothetical protein DRH93_08365 [Deltaproteobacteria bacterium]
MRIVFTYLLVLFILAILLMGNRYYQSIEDRLQSMDAKLSTIQIQTSHAEFFKQSIPIKRPEWKMKHK